MSPAVPDQLSPPTAPLPRPAFAVEELDVGQQLHGEIKMR